MIYSRRRNCCILALLIGTSAAPCLADVLVPGDLKPGDSYHLVFVTDGVRNAEDSSIGVYNDFVTGQANLVGAMTQGWRLTWHVLGSTSDTGARDNAVISGPIYLLDGMRVADGAAAMWNTPSLGPLRHPLDMDQFGKGSLAYSVFTGTTPAGGMGLAGYELGNTLTSKAAFGLSAFADDQWLASEAIDNSRNLHFYALSERLTVPTVAEPSSVMIWLSLAGIGLPLWGKGRVRRQGIWKSFFPHS